MLSQSPLSLLIVCSDSPPQGKCTAFPLQLPPNPDLCMGTSLLRWKRVMHSYTSRFHHQLSHFSSTHSLPPPPLSHSLIPSLLLLLVLSIALLLLSPLSLGPGHMQEGRPGRCSSGKKKARGKCSAAISTGGPSPLARLCQKREGFYYSQSMILTLCLPQFFSAGSAPQYHATSGFALLLLRPCCAIFRNLVFFLLFFFVFFLVTRVWSRFCFCV